MRRHPGETQQRPAPAPTTSDDVPVGDRTLARLPRNVGLNLLGLLTPVVLAALTIPWLLEGLGTARFGALALVWAVLAYLGLFDLGLGRALTWLAARRLGEQRSAALGPLVWSSQALTALLGVVAGGALFAAAPWLCGHVLRIPDALLAEATGSFRLLAVALPIIVTAAGLRGLLEAQQRFDVIAGVRLFLGVVTFVGPALMMPFTRNLVAMTLVLVVGRLLGWAALAAACWRVTPSLRRAPAMDRQAVGELVRFGGWMTVTNLVTPIMTYLDRFALAALVSLETVGHATTIFEAATRIAILPVALVGVLFPAFSTAGAMDASRRDELYRLGLLSLVAVLYPMILAIIAFGQEGLRVWVGADIALAAGPALKVLALGVFVNALGHVPFALVQGCGRADLTAKLHLLQLPPYVVAVWWLVSEYGLMGAVVAWSGRAAVDALGMFVLAVTAGNAAPPRRSTLLGAAVAAAGVAGVVVAPPGGFRVALFATAVILFTVVTWRVMLRPGERATFGALIDPVRRSRGDR